MPKKRATVIPTATQEDMQEFVGILARMRNGNETEIPALLASKVEFLLSRDIATLMKRLEDQAADENEMGELQTLFNAVIDFVEQFVGNTAMLSQANGQLLRWQWRRSTDASQRRFSLQSRRRSHWCRPWRPEHLRPMCGC